ncbi:MAG: hypothetical protein JRC93_13680 [Deltaproteobacteria bacterium]|nr:hypothetical protein [Deltaproteobacteria bacterium]
MDKNIKEETLPQEVVDAKNKGGVLKLTGEDDNVYFFKSPGKSDINRYLSLAAKGKLAAAVQNLVFDLAVCPARTDLKTRFDKKPGLMIALNNALQNAVGLNEEFEVKKL